jgi:hypothetical protein
VGKWGSGGKASARRNALSSASLLLTHVCHPRYWRLRECTKRNSGNAREPDVPCPDHPGAYVQMIGAPGCRNGGMVGERVIASPSTTGGWFGLGIRSAHARHVRWSQHRTRRRRSGRRGRDGRHGVRLSLDGSGRPTNSTANRVFSVIRPFIARRPCHTSRIAAIPSTTEPSGVTIRASCSYSLISPSMSLALKAFSTAECSP